MKTKGVSSHPVKHIYFILFVVLVFAVSYFAEADGISDLFGSKEPPPGSCAALKKKINIPEIPIVDLIQQGKMYKEKRLFCEAAAYFKEAITLMEKAEERTSPWVELIESYFFQYDYQEFFDEALSFLSERAGSPEMEYIHYLALRGVYELAKNDPSIHSPWVQFALGANPEQFNLDSIKNMLKFRSFFETYPQSQWIAQLRAYHQEIRYYFNQDYLSEGRLLAAQNEFVPAIVRFQFLLNQGPSVADFSRVIFDCLVTVRTFADNLENELKVPAKKLARWLLTTEDKITTQKRSEIKRTMQLQARNLLNTLVSKYPEDKWTRKAVNLFGLPRPLAPIP
jgi:outer membrane protein assembly factor BamD (BamD/ComL family)